MADKSIWYWSMTIKKQGLVFLILTILFMMACNSVNRVITDQGNSATTGYDIDYENAVILSGVAPAGPISANDIAAN